MIERRSRTATAALKYVSTSPRITKVSELVPLRYLEQVAHQSVSGYHLLWTLRTLEVFGLLVCYQDLCKDERRKWGGRGGQL